MHIPDGQIVAEDSSGRFWPSWLESGVGEHGPTQQQTVIGRLVEPSKLNTHDAPARLGPVSGLRLAVDLTQPLPPSGQLSSMTFELPPFPLIAFHHRTRSSTFISIESCRIASTAPFQIASAKPAFAVRASHSRLLHPTKHCPGAA